MSAVAMMSFTATGQPSIGESSFPDLYRRVAASAAFRAARRSSVTNAWIDPSYRLTAARHCSRNARGVLRPSRKAADARTKEMGSGRLRGTELLVEELERPCPRLRRRRFVFLQADGVDDRIVAGEGVPRLVPVERVRDARGFQLRLELVDVLDLEEAVVDGEVAHQRRFDLRRIDVVERREAVPRDRGVRFRHEAGRENRQRTAHAVAGDADLRARLLQILHGAADVLGCRVAEVQAAHQVLGLLRVETDFAAIEIGHERAVSLLRVVIGHAPDVIVDTPPLLDDDEARRFRAVRGLGVIAGAVLPIWTCECNCAHGAPILDHIVCLNSTLGFFSNVYRITHSDSNTSTSRPRRSTACITPEVGNASSTPGGVMGHRAATCGRRSSVQAMPYSEDIRASTTSSCSAPMTPMIG